MKNRRAKLILLILMLGAAVSALAGCRTLPGSDGLREEEPVSLRVSFGPDSPEDIRVTWEPNSMPVDSAEITVTDNDRTGEHEIRIEIQVRPSRP